MLLLILIFQPDVKENLDHPPKPATSTVLTGCLESIYWSTKVYVDFLPLVAGTVTSILSSETVAIAVSCKFY